MAVPRGEVANARILGFNESLSELFLEKFNTSTHPVWILLGDGGRELCDKVLVPPNFLPEEIGYFDASRESIDKIQNFLLYCPIKTKVLVCEIQDTNKTLVSAFLKRFEEVKPNTKVVILARSLPDVLYNRGIVVQVEQSLLHDLQAKLSASFERMCTNYTKGLADLQKLLESDEASNKKAPKTLLHWYDARLLRFYAGKNLKLAQIGYEVREKLVDLYDANLKDEISAKDAMTCMLSMIRCAGIEKHLALVAGR